MTQRRTLWLMPLVMLVALSAPRGASANVARGGSYAPHTGWYLPFGLTLGGSNHQEQDGGFFIGAEASLVLFRPIWLGVYVDALYDTTPKALRASIGPEAGWGPFGLDLGAVLQSDDGALRAGFCARALLTIGVFAVFHRHTFLFGEGRGPGAGDDWLWELGVLIKYPALLVRDPGTEPVPGSGPMDDPAATPPPTSEQPPASPWAQPPSSP
jgi:hypothetical protein